MLPDAIPTLTGHGVVLRPFAEADAPLVQSVADDPLIPLITTVPTTGTREDALAYIARQHDRLRTGAGYSFAIADPSTDEAFGQVGVWTSEIAQGRARTGYWIASPFRRRGFARAALASAARWALGLEEIRRAELHVEPWNEGSWRTAEACGFAREGLLRSWEQVGDERRDMLVYSRLPGE
ncbi:GNAT family protein [Mobilicoccus sp.]|uniref:GNAT family N-acetyltransferase n=1 Tax=Mobilicoccus sp. TaxID=2034349 RepID=UPI00289A97FA|nr:GNAT family protein [Mobilicoccus sp.]